MIENLIQQLRRDEDEVLHAYQDKYGYWTIGVGRLIDARKGGSISKEESSILLAHDISERELAVVKNLPWVMNLDPIRRAVLTNVAFNVGTGGLMQFHRALTALRAGQFADAATELLNSKAAKVDAPERYKRLAQQIISGEWQ